MHPSINKLMVFCLVFFLKYIFFSLRSGQKKCPVPGRNNPILMTVQLFFSETCWSEEAISVKFVSRVAAASASFFLLGQLQLFRDV